MEWGVPNITLHTRFTIAFRNWTWHPSVTRLWWLQAAMAIVLFLMIFGIGIRGFFLLLEIINKIMELCKSEEEREGDSWDTLKWLEGADVPKAFAPGLPMKHILHGSSFAVSSDHSTSNLKPYRVSFSNGSDAK